jgi:hypothetical protein
MRGAIPSLPNTPSWRGAQLKKKSTGITLPLPHVKNFSAFSAERVQHKLDMPK